LSPSDAAVPAQTVLYDLSTARPDAPKGLGSEIIRMIALAWLKLNGWKMAGDWPREIQKCVLLAAPHTSNWDGLNMLAAAGYFRIRLRWMGKKALTEGPFGWIVRRSGCVPVDRSGGKDTVGQTVAAFAATDVMVLAISPEGTRSLTEGWRSGFYHIAHAARVPIVLSVLDYGHKTISLAGHIIPSGDYAADLVWMKAQYAAARGLKDEHFTRG
jgi:1-acyl-sn-glycerol-3-phosphate acyltransferase